ncbi:MAG: PIN domain-containing protein [Acidobacteria bacterium]|jgi:predicted nucleic acid-binding protein|nr:PIN domain-containing protein [Acidobacteriota bacterium]
MKILLDNDVVLDYVLERQPFYAPAAEIFMLNAVNDITVYVSGITPVNVFYTGRKLKGKDFTFKAVRRLLLLVEVCRMDKQILQNAFALNFTDYEDAVQCASALAENLDAIVTRNTKDYKNSSVKVYSPSEFLQYLQTT